ncbi:hypothetical protein K2173_009021 [Erythroxylum novogranatense]|uniref:TIR domain-containing protein n=1 Tax=Erythroxylum novogranatense TaxID=1862640 RepID=A0AAV8TV48_9ROSI|nr:hypothetical protein K2173_009021 [Erythroxylum novogranatense]
MDDNSLERGEQLSFSLQKAIEESRVSVIIFSQNYAGSRWCLDELVKIMKCKKERQQIVVPVFYEIESSNVRHQTEAYMDAFKKHEERYIEDKNKIRKWREALTEAANVSGWSSRNIRDESQLVKAIVGDILSKLNRMSPIQCSNMVGIDSRFKKVESLLCMEDSQSVRMVGIWGMWGSGKTAIAKAVFDRLHTQFDEYYFFPSRIVSSFLGEHNKNFVKDRLSRKRVLVVLDGVDDFMQLQNLSGGNLDKFGGGSRILITTTDRKVLYGYAVDVEIYEVERLSHYQALELFSLSAFGQNHPPADYMDMSIKAVDYCDSNPLALKDFGSSLCKKTTEEWQSALRRQYLNPYIQTLIRSSYDGLSSDAKNVFLDIACFFRGEDRSRIVNVLESCYPSAHYIISCLQDLSLVSTSGNKMEMSLLIQNLGWSVVHEAETGKYSRLRNYKEVSWSLETPKGKEAIESIFLDISENEELDLKADFFKEMDHLRLLKFFVANSDKCNERRVKLPEGLNSLSDTLRYIYWHRFPLNSLPKSFSAERLVELILPFSEIKELGLGKQISLANLKRIDLSHSRHLLRIPELSRAENVEIIILRGCKRLVKLPKSVQHLKQLKHLDLSFCKHVKSLPGSLDSRNLKFLDLSYCSKIEICPGTSGKLELLDLSGTRVKKLPSSTQYSVLRVLRLVGGSKFAKYPVTSTIIDKLFRGQCQIQDLPSSILRLTRLVELELIGNTLKMPQSQALFCALDNLMSLNRLALKKFNFESLPNSIGQLPKLQFLILSNCKHLQSIKQLPSSLEVLQVDECSSLESLFTIRNLRRLNLANCFMLDRSRPTIS